MGSGALSNRSAMFIARYGQLLLSIVSMDDNNNNTLSHSYFVLSFFLSFLLFHSFSSIFEFLGALVLGRVSTDTIAGKIAIPAAFSPTGGYYCYDNRYCGAFARGRRCADQFINGKLDSKTYFAGCQTDAACAVSGAVKYTGSEACRQDDRTGQLFFEPGNPMAFAYGMMWVLLIGTGK